LPNLIVDAVPANQQALPRMLGVFISLGHLHPRYRHPDRDLAAHQLKYEIHVAGLPVQQTRRTASRF